MYLFVLIVDFNISFTHNSPFFLSQLKREQEKKVRMVRKRNVIQQIQNELEPNYNDNVATTIPIGSKKKKREREREKKRKRDG